MADVRAGLWSSEITALPIPEFRTLVGKQVGIIGLDTSHVVAFTTVLNKGPKNPADAAKFAGASLEVSLLIAGIREAAKRIEDAQRTFARPVAAPLVPPKPRPAAPDVPPPLPGPPPLPRRDHA